MCLKLINKYGHSKNITLLKKWSNYNPTFQLPVFAIPLGVDGIGHECSIEHCHCSTVYAGIPRICSTDHAGIPRNFSGHFNLLVYLLAFVRAQENADGLPREGKKTIPSEFQALNHVHTDDCQTKMLILKVFSCSDLKHFKSSWKNEDRALEEWNSYYKSHQINVS